uniref:AIPP2-like SPOC-like domain-containing protein n=1 Tax=Brassica campestris TaxID=3711 RepID=M4D923_BRACM
MSPGHSKMPSDSIKVVPGRSKLRVESSNPVARGTPMRRTSKVMLITPEEAVKLSSGFNQVLVPPVSESPRPKIARATSESPRPKIARATSESPRPVLAVKIPEALRPVPAVRTPEASRPVLTRPTFEPPRSVAAHSATGLRKKIVCGLPAMSLNTTTVRRRTNPRSFHQSTDGLPPSPRALQIRSRIKQQAATTATHTVEGTVVEVGDKAKDHDAKETCQPASNERISELLRYLPALHPTWKGRIVDSASLPEFDCEFCAKPASNISRKALRLSKAMPTLLEVELLPTGHILNDVFHRSPRLSDVELYLFSDEKETERSKMEHAHLFEAMSTRNAMIKANINGTELLIFSSKQLDQTSQFFLKKQYKTENYLWGFFLSQAHVPGTSYQTDRDVVDMDIDTEYPTPNLALKLIAESQSIPSSSPVKRKREVNAPPPGFEKANKQIRWRADSRIGFLRVPSSRPRGSSGERPSCSYQITVTVMSTVLDRGRYIS